jgi:hypothetical protein
VGDRPHRRRAHPLHRVNRLTDPTRRAVCPQLPVPRPQQVAALAAPSQYWVRRRVGIAAMSFFVSPDRLLLGATSDRRRKRPDRTSTSSVGGGAGLLHPRGVAEIARGARTATPLLRGDCGPRSVRRSSSEHGGASCLLALKAAALSKRPSPRLHDRARRSNSQRFRRRAAAPAQTQWCPCAEPRHPRDDRISRERSSRRPRAGDAFATVPTVASTARS